MAQTRTASATASYTVLDVEKVVRRVKADLLMIADSTGAWTPEKAGHYAHDIEVLAKAGYLDYVDVTLLSNGVEVKATRFEVDTDAGGMTCARPGGVLWPKVAGAYLRLVLGYSSTYTSDARAAIKSQLKIDWSPTDADTSHSSLNRAGG
jgi:hypothetical protein